MSKNGTAGSIGLKAYLSSMETAIKLAKAGAQLSAGDWREKPGAMIHNPYTSTIAEMSMFLRAGSDNR